MREGFFYPISSGSKGNSSLLVYGDTKILIDFGVSTTNVKKSLDKIDIDILDIDAVLITHEHIDHIKGLEVFSKKYNIPIYASNLTAREITRKIDCKIIDFKPGIVMNIGGLDIKTFHTPHDSVESVGYIIKSSDFSFGYVTDIGFMPTSIFKILSDCYAVVIESNYDENMLMSGKYPYSLKQRILSNRGHLSNIDCAKSIIGFIEAGVRKIFVAHMSEENNSEQMVRNTIDNYINYSGVDSNISEIIILGRENVCNTRIFFKEGVMC